jgi:ceramide glucosyltransferase
VSALAAALAVWAALAFAYRAVALRSLARQCDPRAGSGAPLPPEPVAGEAPAGAVLALRPLRGAGAATGSCLESLCQAAATAGVEVALGVEDAADPAVPLARAALARHPDLRAELRVGRGPEGANRKVANLVQLAAGRKADLWLLTDGDVRVPLDYVARMAAAFDAPAVGFATGPYRSVAGRGAASRVDALLTNTHFLPSVCVAARFEGVHFGLGASIAVRGAALERAGGFEALLALPADDYGLAQRVEAAGFELAWVPVVVEHLLEDEGWRAVLDRQLRWARAVRSSRPRGYAGQLAVHGAPPVLGLAVLALLTGGPGWLVAPAWWAVQLAQLWRRRAVLGLRASDLPWLPLVDVLAVLVWAGGLVGKPEPPRA